MAEWLYEIRQLPSVTDEQLEEVLQEQGAKGWELVQVLPLGEPPNAASYRRIFKAQKPQVAGASAP
jgi:hypothetical protein